MQLIIAGAFFWFLQNVNFQLLLECSSLLNLESLGLICLAVLQTAAQPAPSVRVTRAAASAARQVLKPTAATAGK